MSRLFLTSAFKLFIFLTIVGTFPAFASYLPTNTGGNVGINSLSPGKQLDVQGTVRATYFSGDGSGLTNLPSSGGWTDTGTNVYTTTASDRVGIGTNAPEGVFVIGDLSQDTATMKVVGASSSSLINIGDFGNVGNGTRLTLDAANNYIQMEANVAIGMGTFAPSAKLEILTGGEEPLKISSASASANGNLMKLTSVGNVGIGSTAPGKQLDVQGTVRATYFSGDGSALTNLPSNSSGWTLGVSNIGISTTNNVGIGSATPTASIDVVKSITGNVNVYGVRSVVSLDDGGALENNQFGGYFKTTGGGNRLNSYGVYAMDDSTGNDGDSIGVYGQGQSYGVQGVGTMGVVGSGTAQGVYAENNSASGYALYATQVNASGYSLYANGGKNFIQNNLGIGSTSPGQALDIVGTARINGNINLSGYASSSNRTIDFGANYGQPALWLYNSGSSNRWGWGLNAGEMQFFGTAGGTNHFSWNIGGDFNAIGVNELMRLTMAGNLGIGSITPGKQLDVQGTVRATYFSGDGSALTNLPSSSSGWTLGASNVGISTTNNVGIGSSAPGQKLDVQGSMRVLNNGNVGIGTSILPSKLTITLSNSDITNSFGANSHLQMVNTNPSGQNVVSSVIGSNVVAKWRTDYVGNISWVAGGGGAHHFYTGGDYGTGSVRMVIANGGNVGIGGDNYTPTAGLDLRKPDITTSINAGAYTAVYGNLHVGTTEIPSSVDTTGLGGSITLGGNIDPDANADFQSIFASLEGRAEDGLTGNANWGGYFLIKTPSTTGTLTERMRITSSGFVGIGTTPSRMLHVSNIAGPSDALFESSSTNVDVFFGSQDASQGAFGVNYASGYIGSTSSTAPFFISTNNATRLSIEAGGNIGLGTNSPSSLLEVGTKKFNVLSGGNVGVGSTNPGQLLDVQGGLRVLNSGNVGIGTSFMPNKLYVAGTVEMQGFKMPTGSTSTGYVLTSTSVGVGTWMKLSDISSSSSSSSGWTLGASNVGISTTNNVGIGTSRTTTAGLTVMSGNLGVGTWIPSAVLDLNGDMIFRDAGLTGVSDNANFTLKVITDPANANSSSLNVYPSTDNHRIYFGTTGKRFYDIDMFTHVTRAVLLRQMILSDNAATWYVSAPSSTTLTIGDASSNNFWEANYTPSGLSPSNLFKIASTASTTGVTLAARAISSQTGDLQQWQSSTPAALSVMNINGNLGLGTFAPSEKLIITGGNVGIGSLTPGKQLDVQGTVRATYFVGDGSGLTGVSGSSGWTLGANNVGISTTNNVGIGSSAPGEMLDIQGTVRILGGGNLGIGTTNIKHAKLEVTGNGSSELLRINDSGQNDSTPTIITSTGNVGVGTTTASSRLNVYDAASGDQVTLRVIGTGSSSGAWKGRILAGGDNITFLMGERNSQAWLGGHNGSLSAWAPLFINPDGNVDLYLGSGDSGGEGVTPVVTVKNTSGNGAVGIGTINPSATLEVTKWASTSNAFMVSSATSTHGDYMTVNSSGNVGVGSTNPGKQLDVQGTVRATYFVGDGSGLTGVSGSSGWTLGANNVGISTTNNVGMGTTIPGSILHIKGSASGSYGQLNIDSTDSTTQSNFALSKGSVRRWAIYVPPTNNNFTWYAEPGLGGVGDAVTFMPTGNVGIGTTNPNATLSVIKTSTYNPLQVSSAVGGNGDYLMVNNSGNVGVGSTAPGQKLDVQGSVRILGGGVVGIGTTIFSSGTGVAIMNGNVGIGTWTPRARLEIKNNLSFASIYDNGNSSTAITINWNNGNIQKVTMTGNCTFTFTAPGGIARLTLQLVQDGTGGRTATWPGTVKWPGASAPVLTSTATTGTDFISCLYDGTNYYCTDSLDFR